MRKVKTVHGDTWDIIAYREYGEERLMHVLLEANPEHIKKAIFSAGEELFVPEAELEEMTARPPWEI